MYQPAVGLTHTRRDAAAAQPPGARRRNPGLGSSPRVQNFVHVEDLVSAMLAALGNPVAARQKYNICMVQPRRPVRAHIAHVGTALSMHGARVGPRCPLPAKGADGRHAQDEPVDYATTVVGGPRCVRGVNAPAATILTTAIQL